MHPVEHLIYYSCVWFPALLIPQHPVHFMISKFHATISPAPGHDGYDSPIGGGSGGYFHYLHHAVCTLILFPIGFHYYDLFVPHSTMNVITERIWCHWTNCLVLLRMAQSSERKNNKIQLSKSFLFLLVYKLHK